MYNMFSNSGELNASSLKDVAIALSKYASILEENMPSNSALSGQVSLNDEKRNELIERAMLTHEGKIAMAQAMANPKMLN